METETITLTGHPEDIAAICAVVETEADGRIGVLGVAQIRDAVEYDYHHLGG